ncbi:transporter substrate-binding domain-containing protein [Pseudoalteromonas sp. TB43-MNA-CIBAN-0091]|uniref:substrate-binding periplasmic protein n=1 Tax=Pseudoalteromonas sp. TB43-MNA-CIBAN-0091 TaxID=3140416 RepID=UPI0033071011
MKVLFLLALVCLCGDSLAFVKGIKQQRVIIAANPTVVPYVISENDSGIQLEIVKAALNNQDINKVDVHYMSNQRADALLNQGHVDIALNYSGILIAGIYRSQSVVSYENVVVSLKKSNFTINSIYDLATKSVLAFQNAPAYLPKEFGHNLENLRGYEEVFNQQAQIHHLMAGWVDTIILDRRIFLHYLKEYQKTNATKDFVIHAIFPPAARPAYFNNDLLRQQFDKGLANIIQSGEYRTIMLNLDKQYTQRDFTAL